MLRKRWSKIEKSPVEDALVSDRLIAPVSQAIAGQHRVVHLTCPCLVRFQVSRELDKGTFGTVFKAWDKKHCEHVAVKVVRRVKRYVEDALVEVGILDELLKSNGAAAHCVKLYKHFHFREHFCIVTEVRGSPFRVSYLSSSVRGLLSFLSL